MTTKDLAYRLYVLFYGDAENFAAYRSLAESIEYIRRHQELLSLIRKEVKTENPIAGYFIEKTILELPIIKSPFELVELEAEQLLRLDILTKFGRERIADMANETEELVRSYKTLESTKMLLRLMEMGVVRIKENRA